METAAVLKPDAGVNAPVWNMRRQSESARERMLPGQEGEMTRRVTRGALATALLIALCVTVCAWAQEQPVPPQEQPAQPQEQAPQRQEQPVPPQPQPSESVLLRLKFAAGEVLRYRIFADVQGVMRMGLPAGPQGQGFPGEMPVHIVVQGEAAAKVLRVDDAGAARLRVSADNLSLSMEFMGQKVQMTLKNGKYTATQDGKPMEKGKMPMAPGGMKIPVLQEPIEVKVGPRGEVLELALPGLKDLMAMMPGMSMKDMLEGQILLPEQPLTVGETWSDSRSKTLPGLNAPVTYEVKMALNGIETWAGDRKVAKIRVEAVTTAHDVDLSQATPKGAAGAPPMSGTMSMDQQLGGTMLFDATRGLALRFDFQANQNMSMQGSVATPQAGAQSMTMDLQFSIKGAVAKI
jgi:hypothetical protein